MTYYVYILTNKNKNVLYVGVTNDLIRRIYEHKHHLDKEISIDKRKKSGIGRYLFHFALLI